MKTPVVLILFKRADTTRKVFDVIRQAKPEKLFLIADGPRANHSDDVISCQETRSVVSEVDWDCSVLKNFSDVNMGLKDRVSSGLNWVFDTVDRAIILEDDCVPDLSFFQFCEELLEQYQHDERVMMLTGTNILGQWKSDQQSYHFSYYASCWGWATWKRAWQFYDINMKLWPLPEAQNSIRNIIANEEQYLICKGFFDAVYSNRVNSWAYRWFFSRLLQSGLVISPSQNLISNIGFSQEGTNTKQDKKGVANLSTCPISFPLKDPCGVVVDREYDRLRYEKTWKKSIVEKLKKRIKQFLKSLLS